MYRKFLKRLRPARCRAPEEARPDLPRRLTAYLLPGPPGVADHALWTLLLRDPQNGRDCRQRPRRRR